MDFYSFLNIIIKNGDLNSRDNLEFNEFAYPANKKDLIINKNIILNNKRKSAHNLFKNILQLAIIRIGIIIAIIIILLWYVKFK